jgi:hypothetical protein
MHTSSRFAMANDKGFSVWIDVISPGNKFMIGGRSVIGEMGRES